MKKKCTNNESVVLLLDGKVVYTFDLNTDKGCQDVQLLFEDLGLRTYTKNLEGGKTSGQTKKARAY